MNGNPLDPELVQSQQDEANENTTARVALSAIDELKKTKKGYPYLQKRLAEKAQDFHDAAIDGKTPEEREINRLIYKKFKEEIIPMIDIDEDNHRETIGNQD